ncbi:hypothetical protein [Pontibacter anaerobius]|uniref:MG2 domain-containing protein n=1 Tax=Pontibacter anaerobius TaxID=2993940 RepID=A0ABT3RLC0_9BACT|nr:hypothetical protein [Pontibacter anaerobius]MCX2742087.1 hypothetical protein [Pontibacter anaerobius]
MRATLKQLILLLLPLLSLTAKAQQASGVQQVQVLLADEQVRVVHSQPYYAAGERLWFKAFLNKSSSTPPSRALYVELLDKQEKLILRQRLMLTAGVASGDILLPENLPSGAYTLLATTNWIRNYSKGQQYREQLLIVNAREVQGLRGELTSQENKPMHVQFFPEGGSLVAGVDSKMTVAVTNMAGVGQVASGSITSSEGDTVASFRTDDTGLALLRFKPEGQEQYQVQVQAQGYSPKQVNFPESKQNGLALAVERQAEDELLVRVTNPSSWRYTLVAEAGGKVYFSKQGNSSEVVVVPWQAKAGEAVRLLLLNPGGLVEAEQKVLRHQGAATLSITPDRQQYSPRQLVTVAIQAANGPGKPAEADLAVAVTSIKPGFAMPLATHSAAWGGAEDGQAFVSVPDHELWERLVSGKTDMVYSHESLVDAFVKEGIDEPYEGTDFSTAIDTAFVQALPESVVNYALQHQNRERVNEAYGLTEPHATAPVATLPADRVYRLDEYVTFNSVEEAIREATTNLRLSKKKDRYVVRLLYVRPGVKRMMKGEPIYLIDGVVVKSMEEILALDLNDIASFELAWMEESLYAGNLGFVAENGMFAVYTKSGEARERLKEKGYPVLFGQYNRPKEFVPASFSETESIKSAPDFRQLVYWEPQLQLNADGTASFSFLTSDETGTFVIKVQGQTAEGVPVKGETEFQVSLVK